MLGLEKKYPMLHQKGIMGAANFGIFAPITVFLMDRMMITDDEVTTEEAEMFKKLAGQYGGLFGFDESTFMAELMRIGNIYDNYISFSEDARMTWEAVDLVGAEFDQEQKRGVVDILERLATSDEYLDNKEMSILYAVVMACYDDIDAVNTIFNRLYERIIKTYDPNHQMAKALMRLMNFIAEDPTSVKLSILGRPDPRTEGNIPPMLLTDNEFADWVVTISLSRALRFRDTIMNQSRIYWNIAETEEGKVLSAQKGLIKYFSLSGSDDEQIDESINFTKDWIKAIRDGSGNVKMLDETIFQLIILDGLTPDFSKEGIWKITCKKISSGIEIHAFDISGDHTTYWCPEVAKELSQKLSIDVDLLNANYPTEQEDRDLIINNTRALFDND